MLRMKNASALIKVSIIIIKNCLVLLLEMKAALIFAPFLIYSILHCYYDLLTFILMNKDSSSNKFSNYYFLKGPNFY